MAAGSGPAQEITPQRLAPLLVSFLSSVQTARAAAAAATGQGHGHCTRGAPAGGGSVLRVPGLSAGAHKCGLWPQLLPAVHLRVLREVGQRSGRRLRLSPVQGSLQACQLQAQSAAGQSGGQRAATGIGYRTPGDAPVREARRGPEPLLRGGPYVAVLGL